MANARSVPNDFFWGGSDDCGPRAKRAYLLQAFVVFENSDEARRATQKDRETFGEKFGDRYVRVYPTLDSYVTDMQAAVAQAQAQEHTQVRKRRTALRGGSFRFGLKSGGSA
jgi:hypothetical protein